MFEGAKRSQAAIDAAFAEQGPSAPRPRPSSRRAVVLWGTLTVVWLTNAVFAVLDHDDPWPAIFATAGFGLATLLTWRDYQRAAR